MIDGEMALARPLPGSYEFGRPGSGSINETPVFHADKQLIKRVIGNLIQNALTHSAHAITLHLSARKDANGVLFTVADNGPGIPPEYHELIFRKFEQVRTPNVPRVRSSGLGSRNVRPM